MNAEQMIEATIGQLLVANARLSESNGLLIEKVKELEDQLKDSDG